MCRMKKLKCDRNQPCSNCSSRQWSCAYATARPTPPAASRVSSVNGDHIEAENRALQARLTRLEQVVFGRQDTPVEPQQDSRHDDSVVDPTPKATSKEIPEHQQHIATGRWLEDVCTGLTEILPTFAGQAYLEFKTVNQLLYDANFLTQPKGISLPSRDLALRILDMYEEHLEAAQNVMNCPSVRSKVLELYDRNMDTTRDIPIGLVALLLAICAHIGFWDTYQAQVFPDVEAAVKVSYVLSKQALDALDHVRSTSTTNIEAVQAAILLVFLCYHMEGFSARTRMLQATSLAMARELGLHRLDIAGQDDSQLCRDAIIEKETQRKLWWHIASTDWLLSFMAGPTEGTYSVNPKHVFVKKPRNVNAEDLRTKGHDFSRPDSEPTSMSYYFVRVRLAAICREATDCLCDRPPEDVPYEQVFKIDGKFAELVANLPRFLQLQVPIETIQAELHGKYNIQGALQRAISNLMINARRCKLHLPFLIRYRSNPRYAFSRQQCLESARNIHEVRRILVEDHGGRLASFLHLLGVDHHIFYAIMVLVMDLCLNNPHDRAQLLEVRDALKIVNEKESTNRLAARFLQSLRTILQRHKVTLPAEVANETQRPGDAHLLAQFKGAPPSTFASLPTSRFTLSMTANPAVGADSNTSATDSLSSNVLQREGEESDPSTMGMSAFEDIWTDYLGPEYTLDPQSWDALVSDFDMRVM